VPSSPAANCPRLPGWLRGRVPPLRRDERDASLGTAYCAEIVAVTYQAMGLLPGGRRPDWYDAGRFWSGDDLRLCGEARLSGEVAVQIPETQLSAPSDGHRAPSSSGPPALIAIRSRIWRARRA